jgi:hypothetical protein
VSRDLDPGHCGQSCRPPPCRDPNDARNIRHDEIEGAHRKGAAHRLRHVQVLTDLKGDGQILGNCRVAAVAVMTDRFSKQTIAPSRSALRMQEGQRAEVDLRTSVRFIEGQSS